LNAAGSPPFPWDRALEIGLGILRLSPKDFWTMSPRELVAAIRGLFGETIAPIDRESFDKLLRRFPDVLRVAKK
jgi:uncharacterized phage protein (TIGR02216 family)